ncbi:MAG TPA: hypothetical protein VHJ20_14860 [Polyangia bacterium]|nr:hypothetical protein [Polyangia bacterium]
MSRPLSSLSGLVVAVAASALIGACTSGETPTHNNGGSTGSNNGGTTGSSNGGTTGSNNGGTTGSNNGGDTGSGNGGDTGSGDGGTTGGNGGTTGGGGTTASGGTTGGGGTTASGGTTGGGGATGAGGATDGPTRPINVQMGGTSNLKYNGQTMKLNRTKPPQGKLIIFLGGICGGAGSGGLDAFAGLYGFHIFIPDTDTCLTGDKVPQMYKDAVKANPTDKVGNEQIGWARADEWDGKGRETWHAVAAGKDILSETIGALKYGMQNDQAGDWGYFLGADGNSLRMSDVWVAGYSWGSQTWAMASTYVNFGRVIVTSGPVNEGFPNGAWMTDPSATPVANKYMLVSDGQLNDIAPNALKAGWIGPVVMVQLSSKGPYTADQHLFEMVGGDGGTSPGGHTVFCNDNPANQWAPVCRHVFGVDTQ